MSRGRWRTRCPGCGAHTAEVVAVGQPSGAEDFQVAEVVALGQPSGAEDFLGTGQGSACARGRVPRLLLLLLLLRQRARSFCCGLKAEVLLERGGCSSLLHVARGCPVVPIDVSSGSIAYTLNSRASNLLSSSAALIAGVDDMATLMLCLPLRPSSTFLHHAKMKLVQNGLSPNGYG